MTQRGEVWWAGLGVPRGSAPGYRRPVVIVQSDPFNKSNIGTIVVAVVTTNLELAASPGNVRVPRRTAGLPRASVINVSQILTIDRDVLEQRMGRLSPAKLADLDAGLRLVLGL